MVIQNNQDIKTKIFLTNKQKALLKTLPYCSEKNKVQKFRLIKTMFLMKMETQIDKKIKFYSFFPYNYGPFSYSIYSDLNYFTQHGLIKQEEKRTTITGLELNNTIKIDELIENEAKQIRVRFQSEKALVNYVYKKYPEYTSKSKFTKNKLIKKHSGVCTIGYEGEDIDSFLFKLIKNEIDLIVDVRYNPYSMKYTFNKEPLREKLVKSQINYLHIKELGIPREERKNLTDKKSYDSLFKWYEKNILTKKDMWVTKIIELSKTKRIALLCFEKDVNFCHRGIIANRIRQKGFDVEDL